MTVSEAIQIVIDATKESEAEPDTKVAAMLSDMGLDSDELNQAITETAQAFASNAPESAWLLPPEIMLTAFGCLCFSAGVTFVERRGL